MRTVAALCLLFAGLGLAQRAPMSPAEDALAKRISSLRSVPDGERPAVTKELALAIRGLERAAVKTMLASSLANLSTEGDAGKQTLQAVADTLAQSVAAQSAAERQRGNPAAFEALARLAHYEGVSVTMDDPEYGKAVARFVADDAKRQSASFSLKDLSGKQWSLAELRGKVVLVNFWATWCPPCRKEMPDMDALYQRYKAQGLVVLGISDEEEGIVRKYIGEHPYSFPILLDPEKRTGAAYAVQGIPISFVYDRSGKIAAVAVDQRTERQFREMLSKAGLR